jgi:hypothetical protein
MAHSRGHQEERKHVTNWKGKIVIWWAWKLFVCKPTEEKYGAVAFYVRMCSWRPHIIQDKFWNTNMIHTEFFRICITSNFANEMRLFKYFLYYTISNVHKMRLHCTVLHFSQTFSLKMLVIYLSTMIYIYT